MEEAQARRSGIRHLSDCAEADTGEAALSLRYVSYRSYEELGAFAARQQDLLGAVAFGRRPPPFAFGKGTPFIWVDMPCLGGDGVYEVWGSGQPVKSVSARGIGASHNEDVLFGCLQVPDEERLEDASRLVYRRVFDFIDELGFPFLTRVWNYLPRINAETGGIERYRQFNVGRYEAFAAQGRTGCEGSSVDMPAACALGCRGGLVNVYFLASRRAGCPVENPRQLSAFNYPERYGPRTPLFSRAMLMQPAGQRILSISGTASVVGHETRHAGDPAAQIGETIANLRALMDAAGEAAGDASERPTPGGRDLLLKAYLRDSGYLPVVQNALTKTFRDASVAYLQADICRSDLLVEVDGMYFPQRSEDRT